MQVILAVGFSREGTRQTRIVPGKSPTDVRHWRISVGPAVTHRWLSAKARKSVVARPRGSAAFLLNRGRSTYAKPLHPVDQRRPFHS